MPRAACKRSPLANVFLLRVGGLRGWASAHTDLLLAVNRGHICLHEPRPDMPVLGVRDSRAWDPQHGLVAGSGLGPALPAAQLTSHVRAGAHTPTPLRCTVFNSFSFVGTGHGVTRKKTPPGTTSTPPAGRGGHAARCATARAFSRAGSHGPFQVQFVSTALCYLPSQRCPGAKGDHLCRCVCRGCLPAFDVICTNMRPAGQRTRGRPPPCIATKPWSPGCRFRPIVVGTYS